MPLGVGLFALNPLFLVCVFWGALRTISGFVGPPTVHARHPTRFFFMCVGGPLEFFGKPKWLPHRGERHITLGTIRYSEN